MSEKPVTIVVSDLHVGGGPTDPGDDHVDTHDQFKSFIRMLTTTTEGSQGNVELIINGDFLELAQVKPEVYTLGSAIYWCSENESLQKLETILCGHTGIFVELREFQRKGNLVTIAAGNHDVDLYWPRVQKRLQEIVGPVAFAIGDTWQQRYDGRLKISHGHMFDPANTFHNWANPILTDPYGMPRLEMCPGTLFMVKFVNWLEERYPFSDNIKPVTALSRILWREKRLGFAAVGWMLFRVFARHPQVMLSAEPSDMDLGVYLKQQLEDDDAFAAQITHLYQIIKKTNATVEAVRQELKTEEALFNFLYQMMPCVSPEEWMPIFDLPGGASLAMKGDNDNNDDNRTLAIVQSGMSNDKEILREEAKKELERADGPQVVIMGHTHQPDHVETERGQYFNPGSWTRYVDLEKHPNLTLEDLRREEDFPYQLNYIRIENQGGYQLASEMICYQEEEGAR